MHPQQNILQHKINSIKLKPGLVASYAAWKRNGSILEGVDKSGSK